MGILNQQLIQADNENLSKAARKPFSGKADDATVEIGYGGYLYSKDAEQVHIDKYLGLEEASYCFLDQF